MLKHVGVVVKESSHLCLQLLPCVPRETDPSLAVAGEGWGVAVLVLLVLALLLLLFVLPLLSLLLSLSLLLRSLLLLLPNLPFPSLLLLSLSLPRTHHLHAVREAENVRDVRLVGDELWEDAPLVLLQLEDGSDAKL